MKPRMYAPPRASPRWRSPPGSRLFAVPAAANAAVTPTIVGTTLTLTGDATADNITLGVDAAGLITHNFGPVPAASRTSPTSIPAAGVDDAPDRRHARPSSSTRGDGNDTINLSAPTSPASDDQRRRRRRHHRRHDAVDTINGGDGNDRITGFRGNETINGGDGNDVMIWNNGDGNDNNDGGAGVDETLITAGTADDDMTVKPSGARLPLRPHQRAVRRRHQRRSRSSRSRPSRATTAHHRARRRRADEHRRRLRRRHDHHRRRRRPDQRQRRQRHAQRRRRRRPHRRRPRRRHR